MHCLSASAYGEILDHSRDPTHIFHWIEAIPLPTYELHDNLRTKFPLLKRKMLNKIVALKGELDLVDVDSVMEKEYLKLTMCMMKYICRRVEQRPSNLALLVNNTLITSFLPDWERGIVKKCFARTGIVANSGKSNPSPRDTLDEIIESCRRTSSNPLLVPNPRFEENPGQSKVMKDILEAHSVGERALLISGYQGVGKNKIVDYLLCQLNCEREVSESISNSFHFCLLSYLGSNLVTVSSIAPEHNGPIIDTDAFSRRWPNCIP